MSKKQNEPTFLKEQRNDLWMVDVRLIKPDFAWNPRENYTDIDELSEDILQNGVQIALKGRRLRNDEDGYLYAICGGYRRYKACMLLLEQNRIESIRVPFVLESKGTSEIDRLAYTILENNMGKPLNLLEIGSVVKRMQSHGMADSEISERINKPSAFIKNCFKLLEAPEAAKKLIRSGNISSTLVINLFRKEKNFDKLVQTLQDLAINAPNEKITQKKVEAATGKINSIRILRKMVFKTHKTALIKDDKVELYEYTQKLLAGQFSAEELEEMFYITE